MARPSTSERLGKIHSEALVAFDRAEAAVRDERKQCLSDRRFYSIAGAQWEGLEDQFENKPRFEVNKVHLSVIRIFNEYRNNRITVDFVSKDGTKNDELADTCDGLYRADEQDSVADEAYDNAFEEGVGGGFAAWRLRTVYEDEEDEEDERQRIRMEPIFDADTCVFFDVDAKRQDKSDAKHCWVLYSQSVEGFIEEWDDDPASWPKQISDTKFDWATADVVYLAEYYRIEEVRETVHVFRAIDGQELRLTDAELEEMGEDELTGVTGAEAIAAAIADLLAIGTEEVRQKKVKRRRCRKYIMSGSRILEDCGLIAGKHIPIIPYYGKRWFVDNVERCMGQVRLAKDPQRLKNIQLSKLGEIASLSSTEKPLFTPEQIAGHEDAWATDNLVNRAYLLVNPVTGTDGNTTPSGPVGYTKPPAIAPALAALLQLTETDMAEILGNNQQAEKMVSNISGKAVEMIQQRLDMQTFIFMSNFAKAMRRCGEVWLAMAKDVYVEAGRKMKKIGEQGEVESIELNKRVVDENGASGFANDLSRAEFDVAVDVGPSFTSRRDATVRALTGMMGMTQDPTDLKVLSSMAIMNMDGEGLGDLKDYYRKQLVQMGALPPTDEEAKQIKKDAQQQRPDPQAAYLEAEAGKAQALTIKAGADTELVLARAEETKAKTAEVLAGMNMSERQFVVDTAEKLANIRNTEPPAVQRASVR